MLQQYLPLISKFQISKNELGSPPLLTLLQNLRPRQWFSAHLHVYFKAKWLSVAQSSSSGKRISSSPHAKQPSKRLKIVEDPTESNTNPDEIAIEDDVDDRPAEGANESKDRQKHDSNPEEIAIEDEEGDENGIEQVDDISSAPQPSDEEVTYFTALDKSLPNRKFLEASICTKFCSPNFNISIPVYQYRDRRQKRQSQAFFYIRSLLVSYHARLPPLHVYTRLADTAIRGGSQARDRCAAAVGKGVFEQCGSGECAAIR